MSDDKYAGMMIEFLDRVTGKRTQRGIVCYPITRVELLAVRGDTLQAIKVFEADDQDWKELGLDQAFTKPVRRDEVPEILARVDTGPEVKTVDEVVKKNS